MESDQTVLHWMEQIDGKINRILEHLGLLTDEEKQAIEAVKNAKAYLERDRKIEYFYRSMVSKVMDNKFSYSFLVDVLEDVEISYHRFKYDPMSMGSSLVNADPCMSKLLKGERLDLVIIVTDLGPIRGTFTRFILNDSEGHSKVDCDFKEICREFIGLHIDGKINIKF